MIEVVPGIDTGGLVKAGDLLPGPIIEYTDQSVFPIYKGTYKILQSAVSESNSAVPGAAAFTWNELK